MDLVEKPEYVFLRRTTQFAAIAPAGDGVDLVLVLPDGRSGSGRLQATDGFASPLTHRVHITAIDELDAELAGWLRRAWENA